MFGKGKSKQFGMILAVLLLGFFILTGCQQDSASNESEEGTNEEEKNEENTSSEAALPYEKIIVDSPAIAHYMALYDIPLVGVPTTEKAMPEVYEGVTEIGVAVKPNIETIVSLDPDLFIGDQVLQQFSRELVESHGIETLYIDNSSYEAVYDSILQIGELMGLGEKGEAFVAEQRELESEILERAEGLKGKKVALIMGTAESYQLATKNSYLGSMLEKIGVENVTDVEDTDQEYMTFSKESLVADNPDYIIALAHGGNPHQVAQSFEEEFSSSFWSDTTAMQEDQIYFIDSFTFPVTGSVYNVETLEKVVNLLERGVADENEQ